MIVWEKLTLLKIIISIFILVSKNSDFKIFYLDSTTISIKILKFLRNLNISLFTEIDIGIISRKDTQGNSLRYQTEELTWKIVKNNISKKKTYIKNFSQEEERWLKVIQSWYINRLLKKTETFFLLKNYFIGIDNLEIKFFFNSFPIFRVWSECMPIPKNIKIIKWPSLTQTFLPFLLITKVLFDWLRSKINPFSIKQNIKTSNDNPKIFEEYINNIFSRYPIAGHLFWFPKSGISNDQLILYSDRADTKVTKDVIKNIEKYNFSWIELNKNYFPTSFKTLLKVIFNELPHISANKDLADLYALKIYLNFRVEWFRKILKKLNIKVVHQHQEFFPETLCLALATRIENGIFVWNHWSVDHYPISYFNVGFADLVLSWGDYNDGYFNCHNFKYDYLVQTGLISADNITKDDITIAKKIKSKLSRSIEFSITIFDSSHSSDQINATTEEMIFFYNKILNMIFLNEKWGVIIKSKGISFNKIKSFNKVEGLFNQLCAQQRCILINPDTRVIPASMASNISLCFDINSAGILAGLAGQKVIYWDISGASNHPLYEMNNYLNLVFKSFDDVKRNLILHEKGNKDVGCHKKWINIIDPFRDGKGPERSGKLISDFMNAIGSNNSRDLALKKAIFEYTKVWGEEKVTPQNSIKENKGYKIWNNIRMNLKKSLKHTSNKG